MRSYTYYVYYCIFDRPVCGGSNDQTQLVGQELQLVGQELVAQVGQEPLSGGAIVTEAGTTSYW